MFQAYRYNTVRRYGRGMKVYQRRGFCVWTFFLGNFKSLNFYRYLYSAEMFSLRSELNTDRKMDRFVLGNINKSLYVLVSSI